MNITLLICIVFGAVLLLFSIKKLKLRYTLLSALSGMAAFFAADFITLFLHTELPMNAFSLSVSALGGIPGVILLVLAQTFLP